MVWGSVPVYAWRVWESTQLHDLYGTLCRKLEWVIFTVFIMYAISECSLLVWPIVSFFLSCPSFPLLMINCILITKLMHRLLFIYKLLFLYMFRYINAHLQEDTVYTCSIWYCHSLQEFMVASWYTAWVRSCWWCYLFQNMYHVRISCFWFQISSVLYIFQESLSSLIEWCSGTTRYWLWVLSIVKFTNSLTDNEYRFAASIGPSPCCVDVFTGIVQGHICVV